MFGFNMLTRFVLLSCIVAVCMAELSPKEEVSADEWTQHELERMVYDNKVKLDETAPKEDAIVALAGDIDALELADPIKSAEIAESIESALTGYDVVIGDPLNVVNSGTVKDKGVKKQIFQYDPNDKRSLLQTSVQTGCSSAGDSTVISTVGKYRKQVDKEAEVSGSVSGSGFGVSASFAFSASTSSTEVEDFITQKHGSLTMFTMTCSLRHLDVGNTDVGLPPFKWKFANFVTDTLGEVPTGNAPESIRAQKLKFKSLLTNYGTHYIYQATIGARVTTTKFLSQSMTSTMSQSTMKACASASASVDYMAVSASVSAKGCSASDKSKFNSRDEGVTKTVKNSYGTTKVAGVGSTFNMDQMKEPRPIKFKLAPIVDLFSPKALMYGIPEKFGKAVDTNGRKRKALSKRIMSWLGPMFKRENFQKNYCEAFKYELPDCGKKVTASKQRGCGYTGSCGAFKKCVNTNTAPYFQCNSVCLSKPAEMNMDYAGNDITHYNNVASWGACRTLCDKHSTCFAWSWGNSMSSYPKRCFLKSEPALYQHHNALANFVSGPKTCVADCPAKVVEKDMDYAGNDITHSNNVASWGACRNLCDKHSTCFAWSWGSPTSSYPKRCFLKTVRALYDNHNRLPGFLSGPMTCRGSAGKRDEPVEQDEPVLKEDKPVLKQDEPVEVLAEEFEDEEYFEEHVL